MKHEIICGDALESLATLPANSLDSLVTDPPAGIGFMGREWDKDKGGRDAWIEWLASIMREAHRAMKPGAYGLVWALPRTSHWTGMALENAGFQVRDRVSHLFGSGFPKSLNIGDGRGTALKPAMEDWWLIRKPLCGTVAANVAEWGTGALNIDLCRIPSGADHAAKCASVVGCDSPREGSGYCGSLGPREDSYSPLGRWPANFVHDGSDEVLAEFAAFGEKPSAQAVNSTATGKASAKADGWGNVGAVVGQSHGDTGTAARFFYAAKPSTAERNAGLEGLPQLSAGEMTGGRKEGSAGLNSPRAGAGSPSGARNTHPTVKSLALMRYLCRLITPPGGTVGDCFAGSGTTLIAAMREGFSAWGCEKEPEYHAIIQRRIAHELGLFAETTP